MKIAINAILFHNKPRGVGNYFNTLMKELLAVEDDNEYYVFYGPWMNEYSFTKLESPRYHLVSCNIPRGKILRNLYLLLFFPFKVKKYKVDLLHNIDTTPVIFRTCKIISTIHDLAEFVQREKYGKIQGFCRRLYVKIQAKKSDSIITVSEYSKQMIHDILKVDSNRIFVVYNSFSKSITKPLEKKNVFLSVGEIERSKNFGTLIKAFDKLNNKDYQLTIVGREGNDYQEVLKIKEESVNKENINLLGYVSTEELKNIYGTAKVFVFPSKFEGFGIPLIEAMAYSLPVICSNASCLPEVGGDAALYFDPNNVDDLAELMKKVIEDDSLMEAMIKKGHQQLDKFKPELSAKDTLNVYKNTK